MTYRVKRYGLIGSEMNVTKGLNREVIVNTTNKSLHVHDGATPGGFETARADVSNVPAATTAAAGKMTAAQVQNLETIYAQLATIAQNVTDIAALQTSITALQADVAANAAALAAHTAAGNHLAAGTIAVFLQAAAPVGWTITTAFDDRALFLKGTFNSVLKAGGETGGAHDPGLMDKVPSHIHGVTGVSAETVDNVDFRRIYGTGGGAPRGALGDIGQGDFQDPVYTTTLSGNVDANAGAANWTPKYATGIACSKD